ncbi:MAG: putative toxin-antitoxin system toxin component, PIN family [Planctomycetota bacterium]
MKIIFDTNVLISAFISHGHCAELFEHCIRNHELAVSEFIIGEFQDKLLTVFNMPAGQVTAAVSLLRSRLEVVEPVRFDTPACRDADDDAILGTAVRVHAVCIVTGDKDLLDMKKFREVDIILPAAFWKYEEGR